MNYNSPPFERADTGVCPYVSTAPLDAKRRFRSEAEKELLNYLFVLP